MTSPAETAILVISSYLLLSGSAKGGEVDNLNCQVCRAVVDETLFRISVVDPKKTIEVGSFRVDSHGNQARYEVPYAGSETHLTELFEELCTHMHNYGEMTDEEGRTNIVRMTSKKQKPLNLPGIKIDSNKQKKYVSICDGLLEDHDEEMMVVFKKTDVPQYLAEEKVCIDISGMCTQADLEFPLTNPTLADQEEELDELEKHLEETAKKTPNPSREATDEQTDTTDTPDESADRSDL